MPSAWSCLVSLRETYGSFTAYGRVMPAAYLFLMLTFGQVLPFGEGVPLTGKVLHTYGVV